MHSENIQWQVILYRRFSVRPSVCRSLLLYVETTRSSHVPYHRWVLSLTVYSADTKSSLGDLEWRLTVISSIHFLYILVTLTRLKLRAFQIWHAYTLGVGLVIERSQVRLPAGALLGSNSRQVVHTHVPLSPSSIIWYRPRGGDVLRLGR